MQAYNIILSPKVEEQIAGWQINPTLLGRVHNELLTKLATNPVQYLRRVLVFGEKINLFAFSLRDEETNLLHTFQFSVLYADNENDLNIVDSGHGFIYPKNNGPLDI